MAAVRRDKRRERYSRNLEGWNAQGFFSPNDNDAYTTQPDVNSFYRNAPEGEIGIYNAATDALVPAGGPPPATWRILQKQDDEIKASTVIATADLVENSKTGYVAPTIQEQTVGYNGATGSLNTSIVGGLQEFVASARETTPANQPFPVTEGRAIVRSGNPSDYYIANRIAQEITETYDFEGNSDDNFVAVDVISDGTYGAVAAAHGVLQDSNQVVVTGNQAASYPPGDGMALIPAGVTSGASVFKVISSAFDGTNTNVVIDRVWPHATQTIGAGANIAAADLDAAEVGIRFRGENELTVFETSVSEDLGDADQTETVAWVQGSGAPWQIASMEDECAVFQGWTTLNEAWVRDFGAPTLFVDDSSADEYVTYFLTARNNISSAGIPQPETIMFANIVIAAISGSTLEAALDAILTPSAN